MVDLKDDNLDLDTLIREQKLKKLRNKNSYMDAFLQRRKQAADFALEKRNTSGYKYTKPQFYINDEKIIKNKKQNKYNNINKLEDKTEFYKTYNTLKKNLIGKNNSINNIILIEKENNKYYLSQGIPKINNYDCNHNYKYSHYKTLNHHCCGCCKHRNNELKNKYSYNNSNNYNYTGKYSYCRNEYDDDFFANEDINKKYNNIKHHSINLSTKNKSKSKNRIEQKTNGNKNSKNKNRNNQPKNENYTNSNKNTFGNNLKIEKTGTNSYSNNYNYNYSKDKLKSLPNENRNKAFYNINNNKYKTKSAQNTNSNIKENTNTKVISSIKKKDINNKDKDNSSNNIYYEGTDNHNFYDSNKMSKYKYNYEKYIIPKNIEKNEAQSNYYSRNLSEPKNLERNKNLYIIKLNKNSIDSEVNKKNRIGQNQINDISPIRTSARYDFEDNNEEFQNIEKIYDSQSSLNNSNNKYIYNNKLPNNYSNIKNNINSIDNNEKGLRLKSADFLNRDSFEVIRDTPNTKTVSIVYVSRSNQKNKDKDINNLKTIKEKEKQNKNEIIEIINDNNRININKNINILKNKNNNKPKEIEDEYNINNINNINNIYKYKESKYNLNNNINDNYNINNQIKINEKEKEKLFNNKNEYKNKNNIINYNINNNINNNIKIEKEKNIKKEKLIKEINNLINNNVKSEKEIDKNNMKEIIHKEKSYIINDNDNNINIDKNELNINNEKKDLGGENLYNKNNEIIIKKNKTENITILNKNNKNGRNKSKSKNNSEIKNSFNENNSEIKKEDNNIEDYPKFVDQEQNYETIKEKYESFLRQKDEKEPNLQSKILNSMLISKDESNLVNNKSYLIKNLKEKIQILKNNNKIIKESIDYNNEIDDFFNKIKQKTEKNNFILNEYYQGLLNKEKEENKNNDIKNINLNINNNQNIINNELNKENDIIENKKLLIQKSNRLQNMMKYILNNQKYKNYGYKNYNTINFKKTKNILPRNQQKDFNELTLKNNFNNIKLSKYNNAPDINLIVDESDEANIKIIDEDEYTKLKKKNTKSSRPNITSKIIKLSDNIIRTDRDRFNLFGLYNIIYNNNFNFNRCLEDKCKYSFSPRIILKDSTNKIMPPNEII